MEKKILFYDGECGFCNHVVQFIMRHEKNADLYFSPIESEFATRFFQEKGCAQPDLSTFYLYNDFQLYTQSTGALKLIPFLKWYFSVLNFFKIIPICQRDQLYRFVAKNRKRFYAKSCIINAFSKSRFLIE
jgi:predicted DCC family thiol-disulfide oxidoreductase YuxK